jgi:hypothetical protein
MFAMVFVGQPDLFEMWTNFDRSTLWEVERKIGPLPDAWQLPNFNPSKFDLKLVDSNKSPDEQWEGFAEQYNGPWSPEEVRGFLGLIRRMLRVDPVLRPSIESVEMDKWFDDVRGEKRIEVNNEFVKGEAEVDKDSQANSIRSQVPY